MSVTTVNPATGQAIQSYQTLSRDAIDRALRESQAAYASWKETGLSERAAAMKRAAVVLRTRRDAFAECITQEMGKPIVQARSEIEKCALVCDFYAEQAHTFLSPLLIETEARKSYVSFRPLGPVLAVMPWNFPFWQVFRFAAPALMAGNTAVLKHASNVFGCGVAIESVFRDAAFPDHCFRNLLIGSKQVDQVIEHAAIRAVTLTGSTQAGSAVAAQAGLALKKTVLELGGSDPYVILEDADLEQAAATCAASRLVNGGQSCVAAKRFIVVESVRSRFEALFVEEMRRRKMGDPLSEDTEVGPLARVDLRDEVHRQVEESIEMGADLLLGGRLPAGAGAFYPPTVLTRVRHGMPAYYEELFGPVAAIIPAKDEANALAKANDTVFGLGAAVFTQDLARGEEIAEKRLDAGCCFVNDMVRSDPRLPFGGIKESGYGRELSSFGIREFVNVKTVYVG